MLLLSSHSFTDNLSINRERVSFITVEVPLTQGDWYAQYSSLYAGLYSSPTIPTAITTSPPQASDSAKQDSYATKPDQGTLSRSDKIAIGVGLGVGVPTIVIALMTYLATYRGRRLWLRQKTRAKSESQEKSEGSTETTEDDFASGPVPGPAPCSD